MGYVEHPKCLYNKDGATIVVGDCTEEANAKEMGWMTAEEYHSPKPAPEPEVKLSESELELDSDNHLG